MWPNGLSLPSLWLAFSGCFAACCCVGYAIPRIDQKRWKDASSALKTVSNGWSRIAAAKAAVFCGVAGLWRH